MLQKGTQTAHIPFSFGVRMVYIFDVCKQKEPRCQKWCRSPMYSSELSSLAYQSFLTIIATIYRDTHTESDHTPGKERVLLIIYSKNNRRFECLSWKLKTAKCISLAKGAFTSSQYNIKRDRTITGLYFM